MNPEETKKHVMAQLEHLAKQYNVNGGTDNVISKKGRLLLERANLIFQTPNVAKEDFILARKLRIAAVDELKFENFRDVQGKVLDKTKLKEKFRKTIGIEFGSYFKNLKESPKNRRKREQREKAKPQIKQMRLKERNSAHRDSPVIGKVNPQKLSALELWRLIQTNHSQKQQLIAEKNRRLVKLKNRKMR
ncbi:MAG: hypothetical protein PHQ98_04245 [Candidatus ainarchaeum sp.]|nr:hypothetical protein [Candidatus ainarchaeum sp.]